MHFTSSKLPQSSRSHKPGHPPKAKIHRSLHMNSYRSMHKNSYRIHKDCYRIGIEEFRRDITGIGHCNQSKEVGSKITFPFANK